MKNFLALFILLVFLSANPLCAQIVTINDPNFKAKLIALGVDTNSDGDIQVAEAATVVNLNLTNSNISDIVGLEAFVNLDSLDCSDNPLYNLDATVLPPNLKKLYCNNAIVVLDVSSLLSLERLVCNSNSSLIAITLGNLPNLTYLDCYFCQITSLDVSGLPALKYLQCCQNQLTTLNFGTISALEYVECWFNSITSLDLTSLVNLKEIHCDQNQLPSLDVSTLTNLETLDCSYNLISTLDVSNLTALKGFYTSGNTLANLDVSNLTNLQGLFCQDNHLTTLDVSNSPNLTNLYCSGNQLNSLFVKNGKNEFLDFSNNPALQYICGDATQIAAIQQAAITNGQTNVTVNSFCSFALGGSYNTITGQSKYDIDANGCTATDPSYSSLLIEVIKGIDTGYVATNIQGIYNVAADMGTYQLTPKVQNPTYYTVSPASSSINFPANNSSTQIQDFCVSANGVFPDLEVTLLPITVARPGFNATYQLVFHNKGTNAQSGTLSADFQGNKMTFVSASVGTSAQTSNQLNWNYSNLLPFEWRTITCVMHILAPPTNNIGDSINFQTTITPISADVSPNDNVFSYKQYIVGAFDPNDKTCLEGAAVSPTKIGDYLHYRVRFQNTGNYPAENVVIVDSIDQSKFDIASLQIMETSHLAKVKVENNVLQFHFEGIMLADSFSNEPASHGFAFFKIKTKPSLAIGTTVKNKAEIYFDFNSPVVTNTASTTFTNAVGIQTPDFLSFQIYPNPTQMELIIESPQRMKVEIFNALGEKLMSSAIYGKEKLDISHLPNGIYWIKEANKNTGKTFIKD